MVPCIRMLGVIFFLNAVPFPKLLLQRDCAFCHCDLSHGSPVCPRYQPQFPSFWVPGVSNQGWQFCLYSTMCWVMVSPTLVDPGWHKYSTLSKAYAEVYCIFPIWLVCGNRNCPRHLSLFPSFWVSGVASKGDRPASYSTMCWVRESPFLGVPAWHKCSTISKAYAEGYCILPYDWYVAVMTVPSTCPCYPLSGFRELASRVTRLSHCQPYVGSGCPHHWVSLFGPIVCRFPACWEASIPSPVHTLCHWYMAIVLHFWVLWPELTHV